MRPDGETNRLPLRAGAMLLLAVAVVFIGLGWHSAATSDDKPAPAAAPAPPSQELTTTTSAKPAPGPEAKNVGKLCVLNAGSVTGLAAEVSDALKGAGFTVSETSNLQTASISENTVFYGPGQETAAKAVAEKIPGGASADPRPTVFTRCPGGLAVIVVNR